MLESNLINKQAVVCGGSRGIGAAIAMQLAGQGASVTLLARNQQALEKILAQLPTNKQQKHHCLVVDSYNNDKLSQLLRNHLKQHGEVEILINNSGGPTPGLASDATLDAYLIAFQQHLLANQIMTQAVIPGMKTKAYGRIINIISTSVKQPIAGLGVSNTIRAAVASWAKTLAAELGPFAITVNNVLPGATATERLDEIIQIKAKKQNKTIEQIITQEQAEIPLGRFAAPEEIASAVGFLASAQASYINGINLPVDGGRTACL